MLEYCGNPDNEYPNREGLAVLVMGYANKSSMYSMFTPDELSELDRQALEIRRKKYAPHLSEIDRALIAQAKTGDSRACELAYKRFEGWTPTERRINEDNVKLLIVD